MKWSKEDIQYVKDNFTTATKQEMEQHLNRRWDTIYWKASDLGIRRGRTWTEEEINILLTNTDKTYAELEKLIPNRDLGQIKSYCQGHKIRTASYVAKWTKEEKQILIDNAYSSTLEEIWAMLPHKTHDSIRGEIKFLGLSIKQEKFWTPREIDFLKENIQSLGVYEIAKQLNRPSYGIIRKVERLKLIDDAYIINEDNTVTIFDSFPEREVFLVLKKFVNVVKNKERFYINKRKCYIPDYKIITPNKVYLVEYFGGYTSHEKTNKDNPFLNYNDKTRKKIKYYESMVDYGFIPIYPDDTRDDFKGVVDKITFLL